MGIFWGSIHVATKNEESVRAAAEKIFRKLKDRCYVSPVIDGWIAVYPEKFEQDSKPAELLSQELAEDVLQFIVHDDDVFVMNYWRNHKEMICFMSCPGYFDDEAYDYELKEWPGDTKQFEHLIGSRTKILAGLLKPATRERPSEFDFESERLEKIAKVFGIHNAGTSFQYLQTGETDNIEGWKQFVEIPGKQLHGQNPRTRKRQ